MASLPELEAALRQADAAGNVEDAQRLAQAIRGQRQSERASSGSALNLFRSFTEGATFGWGDEIGLGIAAMAARLTTDKPVGEIYDEMVFGYRGEREDFREQSPVASTVAELAGGIATGGGIAKAASRLAPAAAARVAALPGALRFPAAGGVAGGVAGAGFSDEGERLQGAATGAVLGGAVGGAAAGAGSALTGIANRVGAPEIAQRAGQAFGRQAQRAANAIPSGVPGSSALQNRASALAGTVPLTTQRARTLRVLAREMQREGLTPRQIGARLRRLGPGGTIADVGGANVRDLAEQVGQQPGPGRARAVRTLVGREARSTRNQRAVRGALNDAMPNQPEYFDAIEELAAKRSREAGPIYESVLGRPVNVTPALESLSKRPTIASALRRARTRLADEGLDPDTSTLRLYQYAKEHIDGLEGAAIRGGNGTRAKTLGNARRALVSALDEQFPDYARARAAYEAPSRAMDLIKDGRDFLKRDPEELRRFIRTLSPEEQRYYRTGVYRGIMDRIEGFAENRAPRAMFAKPRERQLLQAAMGNDKGAARQFMRLIANESQKKITRNQVLGNSATARRLAKANDAGMDPNVAVSAVVDSPETVGANVARQLISRFRKAGLSEKESKELGDILFTTSPREQADILARLDSPSIALPPSFPGYSVGFGAEAGALAAPR